MSRAGAKNSRKPLPPGSEFNWQKVPGELPDTAPTPLFPKYEFPKAEQLQKREKAEVEHYRTLRERFHNGPYYAVVNAASISAKQGTKERAHFDPFHGMQSYSARYQKRKRTIPKIAGREYIVNFFPRELWRVIQPNYQPDKSHVSLGPLGGSRLRAQFEDDGEDYDENADEERPSKKQKADNDDEDEQEDDRSLEGEEDREENDEEDDELRDDDFSEDDDEMGGDYNAEQYFDAGDDEGDGDGFGDGGGGGGDDDYY